MTHQQPSEPKWMTLHLLPTVLSGLVLAAILWVGSAIFQLNERVGDINRDIAVLKTQVNFIDEKTLESIVSRLESGEERDRNMASRLRLIENRVFGDGQPTR